MVQGKDHQRGLLAQSFGVAVAMWLGVARSSPVHMIKLTQQREITPYKWVHPDEDERR
jgi:hypothetical protein